MKADAEGIVSVRNEFFKLLMLNLMTLLSGAV